MQRALLRIHRWSLIDADLTFGLLRHLARAWIDHERGGDMAAKMVADVPNKTMEVDDALREMPLEQFMAEHGHRSFSLDIAEPTFAEEPEKVTRMKGATRDRFARRRTASRDENIPSLLVARSDPSSFWKRAVFGAVLALAPQLSRAARGRALLLAKVARGVATFVLAASRPADERWSDRIPQCSLLCDAPGTRGLRKQ